MQRKDIVDSRVFYKSSEWRTLRYETLRLAEMENRHNGGAACRLCGRTKWGDGATLHVDHIKPRWLYPELALSPANLQVLCADCNVGKSWKFQDRWNCGEAANDRQYELPLQSR
jgi:5-methylcytosine-specific restriction endonuclease McrA